MTTYMVCLIQLRIEGEKIVGGAKVRRIPQWKLPRPLLLLLDCHHAPDLTHQHNTPSTHLLLHAIPINQSKIIHLQ
eukprot:scaffold1867_cov177-Ochromonas_danica.AAC.2